MKYEFSNKIEKGDLMSAKMHDTVTVNMSSIDKKVINYTEFCINHHAAKIAADLEIDKIDPNKVMFKFIPKVDKTKMSKKLIGSSKVVIETREYFVNHYLTPTYENAQGEPTMSVLKGDVVETKEGIVGKITKYSSNAEITIERNGIGEYLIENIELEVTYDIISKDDIVKIIKTKD